MNENADMLDFVKRKLEEKEEISPEALSRLLAAAKRPAAFPTLRRYRGTALLAASLTVAACGWFNHANATNARRERDLTNIIKLLRAIDGVETSDSDTLSDSLLAWQDAPTLFSDSEQP